MPISDIQNRSIVEPRSTPQKNVQAKSNRILDISPIKLVSSKVIENKKKDKESKGSAKREKKIDQQEERDVLGMMMEIDPNGQMLDYEDDIQMEVETEDESMDSSESSTDGELSDSESDNEKKH